MRNAGRDSGQSGLILLYPEPKLMPDASKVAR